MTDEDAGWNWHDQRGVTWAAGVSAVALIVLLVWAVIRTAAGLPFVPGPASSPTFNPSVVTFTTREPASSSTSSYPTPSVQTSTLGEPPPPPPPPPPSSSDVPASDEPMTSTPTSTTTVDPYVTTTQPLGGAV